jgi:hypothetical protein
MLALFLLSLIALCCFCKKIEVLVVILKCAAHFVGDTPCALLVPPIFFLCGFAFFMLWCSLAVYLYTSGTVDETSSMPFGQFKHTKMVYYMFWYFLFGGLWGFAMLLAV